MRIARLDLLRFGKFTDKIIALPGATQDFHLIVGPNEAGKSTLRNAIQDLLFGIETRSRYDFVHKYAEMRLGALIEHGDTQLDFIRLKARLKSLQSIDGSTLPENALLPFLGQVDRTFFDQMFGLNHERLVNGGQEILSASNDVGQILFQASAGIGSLGTISDRLEQEADGLWASRKSDKREYYIAASELEQAEAALKQATVRTKDWQEANLAVESITGQLQQARGHYSSLDQARLQLERVRRTAPMLTTLTMLNQQLSELGAVIELPENATAQLADTEREIAIASQALQLFENQRVDLTDRITAIHPDTAILARAADIEALSAQRQGLSNFETDIAKREIEIRLLWQDVLDATRQLGWPIETEESLTQRLPGAPLRARLDKLVRQHDHHQQALANAQEMLRGRQSEIRAMDAEIASLPESALPVALTDALATARSLGDVSGQEKRLASQIGRLQRDLEAAEAELGEPHPELTALRAVLPPSQDETGALIKRREELERSAATARERILEANSEINSLTLEISQYKAAHQPVTAQDVAQGRARRDASWHDIRAGRLSPADAAPGYEQAVDEADALSDRRHDKAQQETELQGKLNRLEQLQLQLHMLGERLEEFTRSIAQLDQSWHERAAATGLSGIPLLGINAWRSARERVLAVAASLNEAQAAEREFSGAVAQARLDLLQALPGPVAQDLQLPVLILQADQLSVSATRNQERRDALVTQKARAEALLPDLIDRERQAQAGHQTWQDELQKQASLAHLPAQADIDTIESALTLFERMHQKLEKIREIRSTRIDMMRRDLDRFAELAQNLAAELAPDIAAEPAARISLTFDERLKQHSFAAQQLERFQSELDKVTRQAQAANARIATANAGLEPLLHLCGAVDHDALRQAAARSDRQRDLMAEKAQTLRLLLNAGDGLNQQALMEEFNASDIESVGFKLAENKRETDEVVSLQNRLSGELTSAQAILAKIAGQGDAARAESQRQEALARMANALERYIKVYTAARLLRWAIEKFRESRQGPMLARASEVFLGLTQGAFTRLVVNYESEPLKLSGQRATGELVEIEGMSEGTRDQLYLALRLSALEMHLEQSAPLPFIADDLFINYDDGRARAGLEALARLSASTQVIFLSHHAHLVPVAQSVFGKELNVVHLS